MSLRGYIKAILITLFVIGCFSILYYVYFLMPKQILEQIGYAIHQEGIEKIQTTIQPLLALIFIQIIITVAMVIINRRTDDLDTNIIYVDKYREKEKTDEVIEKQEHKSQFYQKKYAEIFQKIESAEDIHETLISEVCNFLNASTGLVFTAFTENGRNYLKFQAGYACQHAQEKIQYQFGEGITGQVAKNKQFMVLENVPEDYIQIFSGLGKTSPSHLLVMPMTDETQEVIGVMELASFQAFTPEEIEFVQKLGKEISKIMTPQVV